MKYIKLTYDRKQETLFECLLDGFEYLGGTTEELLFDNMKTVVVQAKTDFSHVVLNETFRQFSKDDGFTVNTCRGYRPQTKGKVETLARIMNRLKAYNEEFSDIKELETIISNMNNSMNNETVQGINEIPFNRHKKETDILKPVNINSLKHYFSKQKEYKVSKESMITYKGKKYSVPLYLLGKFVTIKEGDFSIYIYYTTDFVCSYNFTLDYQFNYKESHYRDILKNNTFKHKSDDELDEIIQKQLEAKDGILIVSEEDYNDQLRKFD